MVSDGEILAFVNRPGNFLYALDWRQGACEFVPASREALSELPFLDSRTLGQSRKKGTLPLARVLAAVRAPAFNNRAGACDFIFHTSFCGSTLLARLLDAPGRLLALREPFALLGLSALSRAGLPAAGDWAEVCLTLLSRPFAAGERTVVKPSNGANNLLPVLSGRKHAGKILLLHGPLEGFLLAVLGGGPSRQEFVEVILEHSLRDAGLDPGGAKGLAPLERAAFAWGLQMKWFEAASRAAGPGAVKTLDAEKLLADPAAALAGINAFFGFGFSPGDIAAKVSGPILSRYAKDPSLPFDPAAAQREKAALRERRRADLEAAIALANEKGLAFPQGLSNPLV